MSTIFNRIWRDHKGSNRSGMVHVTGSFTTTTAGAISTSDTPGFTVTKTADEAGRYRIQLVASDGSSVANPATALSGSTAVAPWGIQAPKAIVVSPNADAALATDEALHVAIRNFQTRHGYFDFQFYKDVTSTSSETHVDADLGSGVIVLIEFWVKTSSVVP
jgi:hypothetical protein